MREIVKVSEVALRSPEYFEKTIRDLTRGNTRNVLKFVARVRKAEERRRLQEAVTNASSKS